MRLLILFSLITISFIGCDKIPDSVIDPSGTSITGRIISINSPDSVVFSPVDSVITVSLLVNTSRDISTITLDMISPRGNSLISSMQLFDDGDVTVHGDSTAEDNLYSTLIPFAQSYPNGNHKFEFYIRYKDNSIKYSAVHYLYYFNGKDLFPPIISDLIMPISVNLEQVFTFSVQVYDENGISDIRKVFFHLIRPDGTIVIHSDGTNELPMYDDGNTSLSGDVLAGDGIYSLKNHFSSTAQTGDWIFEFQARDWADSLSNMIIDTLKVNP